MRVCFYISVVPGAIMADDLLVTDRDLWPRPNPFLMLLGDVSYNAIQPADPDD